MKKPNSSLRKIFPYHDDRLANWLSGVLVDWC